MLNPERYAVAGAVNLDARKVICFKTLLLEAKWTDPNSEVDLSMTKPA